MRVPCQACPLRAQPAFHDKPDDQVAFIQAMKTDHLTFAPGDAIIRQGSRSAQLFTLFSGWAFRFKEMSDGRRQILNFLLPGDLVSAVTVFEDRPHFSAQALTEDVAATLPGSPQLIPSPGHTGGHCSYVFGDVLVAGDAVITGHPVITKGGPQLLPQMFNHDQEACERSLSALGLLDTQVLLPGHGPAWRGPVREAAELALQRS